MPLPKYSQDPTLPEGFSGTFRERFWSKVDENGQVQKHCPELGNCWQWTGARRSNGHGQISRGKKSKHGRLIYAHRAMWILGNGPIPEGMQVLHRCDNPLCVRPTHLFLGKDIDNRRDSVSKNRHWFGWGESSGMAKLTLSKVLQIRYLSVCGEKPKDIARIMGISRSRVYDIKNGKGWIKALSEHFRNH